MRGLVIAPRGTVGRTVDFQGPGGLPVVPQGIDDHGRVYSRPPFLPRGSGAPPDTAAIVRFIAGSSTTDTIAWISTSGGTGGGVMAFRSSGGGAPAIRMTPYAPEDGWAVAPGGRIAVVRARDYRVEWIDTDRRQASGPSLPYTQVKIGKAEKEEWADQLGGAGMMVRTSGGSRTGRPPRPHIDGQTAPFSAKGIPFHVKPLGHLNPCKKRLRDTGLLIIK